MKKLIVALSIFSASFALAAAPKVSKACSNAKGEKACTESLISLAEKGKAGDSAAIELYGKTVQTIRKNKALMKPVMVPVDTLVWESCKKKDRDACLEACNARTDSSFSRTDAPDSATCAANPQQLVQKQIKVPTPSSMRVAMDSISTDAFWNSNFTVAKFWMKAVGDSIVPSLDSAQNFIATADLSELSNAKKKFQLCNAYGDALNARLDSIGSQNLCPTFGTFVDPRDNRTYRIERFGEKIWMIDNLNFDIPETSACYDGDSLNCEKFGRLYTFESAKNACPEGFHTATDEDFEALAGDAADFAVTVKFGGYFNQSGICALVGEGTYFWTSTEEDASRGFVRNLFSDANALDKASVDKRYGLSVRCVQE